jgi:hypothetical protein
MIGGLTNPHISLAHGANSRRIFLPCPPKGDTTQCKDGWQSGLMRTPGKRVYPKGTGGSNPPHPFSVNRADVPKMCPFFGHRAEIRVRKKNSRVLRLDGVRTQFNPRSAGEEHFLFTETNRGSVARKCGGIAQPLSCNSGNIHIAQLLTRFVVTRGFFCAFPIL